MGLNIELAEKVLDHIERFPESFDMADWWNARDWDGTSEPWTCDTTACIAGWAIYLSGNIKIDNFGDPITPNGKLYSEYGQELLGLTTAEADLVYWNEDEAVDELQRLIDEAKK